MRLATLYTCIKLQFGLFHTVGFALSSIAFIQGFFQHTQAPPESPLLSDLQPVHRGMRRDRAIVRAEPPFRYPWPHRGQGSGTFADSRGKNSPKAAAARTRMNFRMVLQNPQVGPQRFSAIGISPRNVFHPTDQRPERLFRQCFGFEVFPVHRKAEFERWGAAFMTSVPRRGRDWARS